MMQMEMTIEQRNAERYRLRDEASRPHDFRHNLIHVCFLLHRDRLMRPSLVVVDDEWKEIAIRYLRCVLVTWEPSRDGSERFDGAVKQMVEAVLEEVDRG